MPLLPNMNREMAEKCLEKASGRTPRWTTDPRDNFFGWLQLPNADALEPVARALSELGARLCTVTAYTEERYDPEHKRSIAYHFAFHEVLVTVTIPTYNPETGEITPIPSITPWFRNADWNEREFNEMYNIPVKGHPNPRRLFLDERLDAGVMSKLVPFSAMVHGTASQGLWEQVMASKGIDITGQAPTSTYGDTVELETETVVTTEPIFTPVSATKIEEQMPVPRMPKLDAEATAAAPTETTVQTDAQADPQTAAPEDESSTPQATDIAKAGAGAVQETPSEAEATSNDVVQKPAAEVAVRAGSDVALKTPAEVAVKTASEMAKKSEANVMKQEAPAPSAVEKPQPEATARPADGVKKTASPGPAKKSGTSAKKSGKKPGKKK